MSLCTIVCIGNSTYAIQYIDANERTDEYCNVSTVGTAAPPLLVVVDEYVLPLYINHILRSSTYHCTILYDMTKQSIHYTNNSKISCVCTVVASPRSCMVGLPKCYISYVQYASHIGVHMTTHGGGFQTHTQLLYRQSYNVVQVLCPASLDM